MSNFEAHGYDGPSVKEQIKNFFIFTTVSLGEKIKNYIRSPLFGGISPPFFRVEKIKNFLFLPPFFRGEKIKNLIFTPAFYGGGGGGGVEKIKTFLFSP